MTSTVVFLTTIFLFSTNDHTPGKDRIPVDQPFVIAAGSMPAKPLIDAESTTIVYGRGDSLMLVTGKGIRNLTAPELIAVVPKMYSHAMRGPQAVKTAGGIVITVCTEEGNIYSFSKQGGKWTQSTLINDHESAKEGLVAMAGNGDNLIAIWLNAKQTKGQSVFAARSTDGGTHWNAPREIYNSPEGTVCECCKPSIVQSGNTVFVMFRNWIAGNRDMHLMTSTDAGNTFGEAQKIGAGNWPLNGCPMDGGDLVISEQGEAAMIWRRASNLYTSVGAGNEKLIASGKNGSIETRGESAAFAWTQNGRVMVQDAKGKLHDFGAGSLPLLRKISYQQMVCIWQNENRIMAAIL